VYLQNLVLTHATTHSRDRYLQAEKKPPHGQAHLVFPTHKTNAKKPKELALPHHHPKKIFDNLI